MVSTDAPCTINDDLRPFRAVLAKTFTVPRRWLALALSFRILACIQEPGRSISLVSESPWN